MIVRTRSCLMSGTVLLDSGGWFHREGVPFILVQEKCPSDYFIHFRIDF
jgi:hypothetical protein